MPKSGDLARETITLPGMVESPSPTKTFLVEPEKSSQPISKSINMEVQFTSQAPFGVWDHLHDEACEEASILMAYAWANEVVLDPQLADGELKKLAEWQAANFGFFESTTAEQTARLAKEFYGLNVDLINNPTREEIKKKLDEGNLVVMGMAGRLLGNPHFKPPGPVYHMLIIKGYDHAGFFTNDPGTKYGKNYYYSYDTIMNSAHDWTGAEEEIYTSPAVALVISR
ncbi:MAG: C39 family peptidase [bacterium]|nr:C39 family peptidase [bacterium]